MTQRGGAGVVGRLRGRRCTSADGFTPMDSRSQHSSAQQLHSGENLFEKIKREGHAEEKIN